MTEIIAKGRNAKSIKLIQAGLKYDASSQMVKKLKILTYNTYSYKGVVFTSHDARFIELQKSGHLFEVTFLETEEKVGEDMVKRLVVDIALDKREYDELADSDFRDSLMNVDNFIANPELLTKVSDINALLQASA